MQIDSPLLSENKTEIYFIIFHRFFKNLNTKLLLKKNQKTFYAKNHRTPSNAHRFKRDFKKKKEEEDEKCRENYPENCSFHSQFTHRL